MYNMTNDELLEAVARITPQWLAGFFDGEGCVSVHQNKKYEYHSFVVAIAQKDVRILSLIALRFGGSVTSGHDRSGTFRVQWSGRTSVPLLEFIKDHVICKKRQVEAALEFVKTFNAPGRVGLSQEKIARREHLSEVIRQCNKYEEGSVTFFEDLKKAALTVMEVQS